MMESYVDLFEAGKLTGSKRHDRGKAVYTFAGGTKRLYDFIDMNLYAAAPLSITSITVHVVPDVFPAAIAQSQGFEPGPAAWNQQRVRRFLLEGAVPDVLRRKKARVEPHCRFPIRLL